MRKFFSLNISLVRLLALSALFSILSAVALVAYIVLALTHADVPLAFEKGLFVTGSMMGTFGEVLEWILVIPLLRRAENLLARALLVLALIPYINLLLLVALCLYWAWEKVRRLPRLHHTAQQIHEIADNALPGLPGQIATPPPEPHARNVPATPVSTTNVPTSAIQDGGAVVASAVVGVGSGVEAVHAANTPTLSGSPSAPPQTPLHTVLATAFGPHMATSIITPIRQALPALIVSTVTLLAVTATVGTAAVTQATPLIASTPTSPTVSIIASPTATELPIVPATAITTIATATAIAPTDAPSATPQPTATSHSRPTSTPHPTAIAKPTALPTATPIPPPNLLSNPLFTTSYSAGDTGGICSGPNAPPPSANGGFNSAAYDWTLYNNRLAVTSTHLISSTRTPGKTMIHVCTTGTACGLVQAFAPQPGGGPNQAHFAVWIYMVQGQAGIGAGNAGYTVGVTYTHTTGTWELLQGANSDSPVNEIIIYGVSVGGADFYVDATSLTAG